MPRATLFALCLSLPIITASAMAETAPNVLAATEASAPGPVRQMLLAQQLYDHGLAQDDAFLILSAIRLGHRSDLRPATGWSHSGDGTPAGEPTQPAPGLPQDPLAPEAMALAQLMAEGDSALADLAADIEAELKRPTPSRGQLSTEKMRLAQGKGDSWTIAFNGQLTAEIALISDSALGFAVQDENGHSLCQETAATRAYCAFVPARNGFFTVTVTLPSGSKDKPAPEAVEYRLITN